jgi:hypothetical protein
MRRLLLKVGLCLLLGAIVNVGVAWSCALFSPIRGSMGIARQLFNHHVEHWTTDTTGLRMEAQDSSDVSAGTPGTPTGGTVRYRAGLPMRSMTGERDVMNANAGAGAGSTLICPAWAKTPLPAKAKDHFVAPASMQRLLPVRPIPLGFAVNTGAYASLCAGVLFGASGLRRLRRQRRRARGRCTRCGYQLAGLSTCPECGRDGSAAAS